ncbi:hypothetical protein SESBI_27039, partial [Sesbania bispinosa]
MQGHDLNHDPQESCFSTSARIVHIGFSIARKSSSSSKLVSLALHPSSVLIEI